MGVMMFWQTSRVNARNRFGAWQRNRARSILAMGAKRQTATVLMLLVVLACSRGLADAPSVTPASMMRIGEVDERFQSYNVEMVEVTGGRFWKPYGPNASNTVSDLFAYRPPINLASPRLRKLARALAPAYLRVSGTWANATYFADSETAPSAPPSGFDGVLTRQQWRGVVDFSSAVGAPIVTSFAVSPGTRDAAGAWTSNQAAHLIAYNSSIGGRIVAAEFMNEPNVSAPGVAATSDDPAAYGRDFRTFRAFLKRRAPATMILGPGMAGSTDATSHLLTSSGPGLDAFSYHHYGMLSERCTAASPSEPALSQAALSEDWLARTDRTLDFYRRFRDQFAPGRPIWLTETAEAACGGNRWAATYLDTFRYLDQFGRLAKAGVQVVMHNTLAASDYGLLDEKTLTPRPNYWGALLWRRLMGTTVLEAGVPIESGLHVYAHCQRGRSGGVSLLIINLDSYSSRTLRLVAGSERFTLDAASLRDPTVRLNGRTLELGTKDDLPDMAGVRTPAGNLTFAPATVTFLAIAGAANRECRLRH
jgi:Glycosyl hydrolase family 79, N-terminal domain